jgi:hypothetical protein
MRSRFATVGAALAAGFVMFASHGARADEGGVSFWLPGVMGSLSAVPAQPGWSLGSIYLHSSLKGGGDVAASRTLRFPNRTVDLNVFLQADLHANLDIGLLAPAYTFATPVLGGRLTLSSLFIYGRSEAQIDALIVGALGPIGFAADRTIYDERVMFGDIYPQAKLQWNAGVHNYMVYGTGNIPVGAYDAGRLANLGLGHAAVDGGFGYTYFNPQTGWEATAVFGATYNFKNPDTDYKNGIDLHLDAAVSKFITQQIHVGLAGYLYQQVTGDSGAGATLGPFKSRVAAVGPQIGFIFPVAGMQGYLNLKAFKEFAAEHRAEGWNAWVTFAISPAPPAPAPPSRMIRK